MMMPWLVNNSFEMATEAGLDQLLKVMKQGLVFEQWGPITRGFFRVVSDITESLCFRTIGLREALWDPAGREVE